VKLVFSPDEPESLNRMASPREKRLKGIERHVGRPRWHVFEQVTRSRGFFELRWNLSANTMISFGRPWNGEWIDQGSDAGVLWESRCEIFVPAGLVDCTLLVDWRVLILTQRATVISPRQAAEALAEPASGSDQH
jgi:hypothetical protein